MQQLIDTTLTGVFTMNPKNFFRSGIDVCDHAKLVRDDQSFADAGKDDFKPQGMTPLCAAGAFALGELLLILPEKFVCEGFAVAQSRLGPPLVFHNGSGNESFGYEQDPSGEFIEVLRNDVVSNREINAKTANHSHKDSGPKSECSRCENNSGKQDAIVILESEHRLQPESKSQGERSDSQSATPRYDSLESKAFHRPSRCISRTKGSGDDPPIGISRALPHNGPGQATFGW